MTAGAPVSSPDRPTAALDLIRPDGAVIVPPAVAGDVLRALVRDLTARVRADGGEVAPGVRRLLIALHAADQRAEATASGPSSEAGTFPTARANVEIAARDAAALLGCSTEYVRRLARAGRFQARRVGAAWLIDSADLDRYRHTPPGGDHAAQPQPP